MLSQELNKKAIEIVQALDDLHIKLTALASLEAQVKSQNVDGIIRLPIVDIERHIEQALRRAYDTNSVALAAYGHDRPAEFAGLKKIERKG